MGLYAQFKTDTSLETTGILLQYGNNSKGLPIAIRIARAGGANKNYAKLMEARVKPYRRQIQNETIERALLDGIVKQVFAETVVIGWENVEDENNSPLSFSVPNVLKVFEDLPDLYADIQEVSQKAAAFRNEIREIDAKNS